MGLAFDFPDLANDIVLDSHPSRSVSDKNFLRTEISLCQRVFGGKRMAFRQCHKDLFRPKISRIAFRPISQSDDKSDIMLKLSKSTYMFMRLAFDEIYVNRPMFFIICSKQDQQKSRRK